MDKQILKEILDESGSDKSKDHNYEEAYCQILPDNVDALLEIGIANFNPKQSSIHAWAKVYPEAEIVAMDIFIEKLISDDRVTSFLVDQSDALSLYNFRSLMDDSNQKFDVIIDDGSHIFSHARLTYEFLNSLIMGNGVYCIEDIQKNYHPFQQTVQDWENYLSSLGNVEYKVFDTKPEKNDDSVVIAIWRKNESN